MPDDLVIRYSPTEAAHTLGKGVMAVLEVGRGVTLDKDTDLRADYATESDYMGIEVKTADGLYSDVLSERIDHQVPELLSDFEVPVLLTVGHLTWHEDGLQVDGYKVRRFPWARFQRKLARMGWGGITLLTAKNPREAGQTVLGLLRSVTAREFEPWQVQRHFPHVLPAGRLDDQVDMLARIPGVGHVRARLLLNTFGSASAVFAGLYPQLSTSPDAVTWDHVKGIGPDTVNRAKDFMEATK